MKIEVGTRVVGTDKAYQHRIGAKGVIIEHQDDPVSQWNGYWVKWEYDGMTHFVTCEEIEPIHTLTIEPGKYYRTRDGRQVGPMHFDDYGGKWPWEQYGKSMLWDHDGKCDEGGNLDIIAEWTEDDDMNAICDERQDGPFVRDPELTSPYGDGNHPLPVFETPETGTRAELKVQPGDVVECVSDFGNNNYTPGKEYTINNEGETVQDDGIPCNGIFSKFRIISRAADSAKTAEDQCFKGYYSSIMSISQGLPDGSEPYIFGDGAPVRPSAPDDCGDDEGWSEWTSDTDWDVSKVDMQMECIDGIHRARTRPRKPQPQRETVTLYGSGTDDVGDAYWRFCEENFFMANIKITFTTTDGKPATGVFRNDNGDVIKVEALG